MKEPTFIDGRASITFLREREHKRLETVCTLIQAGLKGRTRETDEELSRAIAERVLAALNIPA